MAAAVIACYSSSDSIPENNLKNLRAVRTFPANKCISFLYDLDGDNKIDIIEYRRQDRCAEISKPIRRSYGRNGDMVISKDEVFRFKDPMPEAGACPSYVKDISDGVWDGQGTYFLA